MTEQVTYDQIKSSIGSLIVLWSEVERALISSVTKMDREPKHLIGQRLDQWTKLVMARSKDRAEQRLACERLTKALKSALKVRNNVCHGLVGIRASDPHERWQASLRVTHDEEEVEITWDELQDMFGWLSRSSDEIKSLSFAALERDTAKARQQLPRLDGFP